MIDAGGLKKRLALAVVRLFARLGLIGVPYGDYDAAQGRREPSQGAGPGGNG